MLNTKFSPWPSFTEREADRVKNIILSNKVNYWTGSECRTFEQEFAAWTDCQYAVALANGTVSLDLALHALEIGEGDEVVVTPRTFLASVSSVVNTGAKPIFADVDLNSQNIEADTIKKVITDKTKAIVVVHLAGMPAEMDSIMDLAAKYDIKVIEDCAQAHGAKYKGRSVGSIGHIGAWSFCQDKIMTTGGEGGMVTTNDERLWKKMWSFKDHGKSWDAVYNTEHPPGFRWLHESFGTNWRMTETQGAIGRIQLEYMKEWHQQRCNNALRIEGVLEASELARSVLVPEHMVHAEYKHYFFVNEQNFKSDWSRDKLVDYICSKGVPCYQGSCSEVYMEKAFEGTGWRPKERLQNAKHLGETSVMLLVHPTLTEEEMSKTCNVLEEALQLASQ